MEKTQTSQNGTEHLEEWVEGKSEKPKPHSIRTKSDWICQFTSWSEEELMAMYPQWSKEIAEAAEMYYGRIKTSLL
jgi:hypothetical protein